MGIANIANKYMMFTFGDWTPYFAQVLCGKKNGRGLIRNGGSVFSNISTAYDRAQKVSAYKMGLKENPSFLEYVKGTSSSWGHEISLGHKKSGLWGGTKSLFKGAGKRMPLVGTALMLAMEVPNLYRAFTHKDGGAVTGTVETGKAALKLGAFAGGAAAGAAIGTLIFPGVGTVAGIGIGTIASVVGSLLGGTAASYVADKALGQSFTEKEEEKAEQLAAQNSQTTNLPAGANTSATTAFGGMTGSLAGLSPEEMKRYQQLTAAYSNYSSNPFGSGDPMDRNLLA